MRDFHRDGFQAEREAFIERIRGTGFFPEIAIGDGWMPLVIEADRKLREIDPDYEIHQIKEKFGALRYYTGGFEGDYADPESPYGRAHAVICEAEAASAALCEFCGAPGAPGGKYWIKTLCPTHREEFDA